MGNREESENYQRETEVIMVVLELPIKWITYNFKKYTFRTDLLWNLFTPYGMM